MTGPGRFATAKKMPIEVQVALAGRHYRLGRSSVDRRYLGCYIRGAIGLWRSW